MRSEAGEHRRISTQRSEDHGLRSSDRRRRPRTTRFSSAFSSGPGPLGTARVRIGLATGSAGKVNGTHLGDPWNASDLYPG